MTSPNSTVHSLRCEMLADSFVLPDKKLFLTTGGNIKLGQGFPPQLNSWEDRAVQKTKFKSVSCKICQECYANLYVRITKHKSVCFARGQWQLKANATQTAKESLVKQGCGGKG